MPRLLHIRRPSVAEVRHLQRLLDDLADLKQRRRAQAILLHGAGVGVDAIATGLSAHSSTIYTDLHAFAAEGVAAVQQFRRTGVEKEFTAEQEAEMGWVAEQPPVDLGSPYARWSLAILREYLLKHRRVKHLSREHLRRILQKRAALWPGPAQAGQSGPPTSCHLGPYPQCLAASAQRRRAGIL